MISLENLIVLTEEDLEQFRLFHTPVDWNLSVNSARPNSLSEYMRQPRAFLEIWGWRETRRKHLGTASYVMQMNWNRSNSPHWKTIDELRQSEMASPAGILEIGANSVRDIESSLASNGQIPFLDIDIKYKSQILGREKELEEGPFAYVKVSRHVGNRSTRIYHQLYCYSNWQWNVAEKYGINF